jgi:hypothetical protein
VYGKELRLLKKFRDSMVGATMELTGWTNGIFVAPFDLENSFSTTSARSGHAER